MEILTSPSHLFSFLKSPSNSPTHSTLKVSRVSIKSPPPEFDYRSEIGDNTRSAVAAMHPELLDLVEKGRLVLIEKRRFGPVPIWRNAFVEPEAIWLVGTSHISEESAADVERVVRAVRPESVVVELCRSRFHFQSWDNLGRAWSSLKWSEKLSLVLSILRGISSPSLDASGSNLKDQEMEGSPFQLYELLSFSYPSLLQPLVHERDTYLAWSLKRSKAVNKSKSVVGVIGRGHMNGVIYALVSDQGDLRFRDLVGQRPFGDGSNGWIKTILKSLIRDTVIGIIAWVLFEQLKTALL